MSGKPPRISPGNGLPGGVRLRSTDWLCPACKSFMRPTVNACLNCAAVAPEPRKTRASIYKAHLQHIAEGLVMRRLRKFGL
jgi:hypothetical protein